MVLFGVVHFRVVVIVWFREMIFIGMKYVLSF